MSTRRDQDARDAIDKSTAGPVVPKLNRISTRNRHPVRIRSEKQSASTRCWRSTVTSLATNGVPSVWRRPEVIKPRSISIPHE
jgi:hypothetical protein